jgi:hypothetical protein
LNFFCPSFNIFLHTSRDSIDIIRFHCVHKHAYSFFRLLRYLARLLLSPTVNYDCPIFWKGATPSTTLLHHNFCLQFS